MPARLIEVRRGEEPISTHTTSYTVGERDIDHYGHLNNRSVIQLSRCAVNDTETGKPRILPRNIEENLRSST